MSTTIEAAIRHYRDGGMLILVDDEGRENEGDLSIGAEHASAETVNFMITHGRGLVCAPISADRARQLELAPMCPKEAAPDDTRFTVSVDAASGIGSGISAHDRAKTIRRIADATTPEELSRPGHIFPLIAREGGVLTRPGHTEAAVDLARLAGLKPSAVLCEVLNQDGTMARLPQLRELANRYNLPIVLIADLIAYRRRTEEPSPPTSP